MILGGRWPGVSTQATAFAIALIGLFTGALLFADVAPSAQRGSVACDQDRRVHSLWDGTDGRDQLIAARGKAGEDLGHLLLSLESDLFGSSRTDCGPIDSFRTITMNAGDEDDRLNVRPSEVPADGVVIESSDVGPIPARIKVTLNGGPGDDIVLGHNGRTIIDLGTGADRTTSAGGRDRIVTGSGKDKVKAGGGRDRIAAKGGGADEIDCGGGRDVAKVDARDDVSDCERVVRG